MFRKSGQGDPGCVFVHATTKVFRCPIHRVHSAAEADDLGGLPLFFFGGSPSSVSSSFAGGGGGGAAAAADVGLGFFGGLPRGRLGLVGSAPSGFG